MLGIPLALGSSLVYGVSDFLGGLKSRSLPVLSVLLVSQSSGLVLLAINVIARGEGPPDDKFIVYGAIAGLCEAVGVAAFYRGLAVGVMSIVSPIAATAPVVPVVAAIILGELPSALQGVGIALALTRPARVECHVAVLSSLYPVVTIALARYYLQERLQRHQQVGAAASLSGAVVISAA